MLVFLLFSFLFLSSNPETQVFASHDGNIENSIQIDNGNNNLQEPDPPDNDDEGKDGIEEDWMFGKMKTIRNLT